MKRIKLVIWLLLAGFAVYFLFNFFYSTVKLSKSMETGLMSHAGNLSYPDLFKAKVKDKLKSGWIYPDRSRNPVNRFYYDEKFDLIIYKLGDLKTESLSQIVRVDRQPSEQKSNTIYEPIKVSLYSLLFKAEKGMTFPKIYLSLQGDSLNNLVKSDSLISYHLKLKSFSLRSQENGDRDIVGEVEGILAPKISYSLVIYKKQDAVYLLTIAPKDRKTVMDPMLLTNLVLNKENN